MYIYSKHSKRIHIYTGIDDNLDEAASGLLLCCTCYIAALLCVALEFSTWVLRVRLLPLKVSFTAAVYPPKLWGKLNTFAGFEKGMLFLLKLWSVTHWAMSCAACRLTSMTPGVSDAGLDLVMSETWAPSAAIAKHISKSTKKGLHRTWPSS